MEEVEGSNPSRSTTHPYNQQVSRSAAARATRVGGSFSKAGAGGTVRPRRAPAGRSAGPLVGMLDAKVCERTVTCTARRSGSLQRPAALEEPFMRVGRRMLALFDRPLICDDRRPLAGLVDVVGTPPKAGYSTKCGSMNSIRVPSGSKRLASQCLTIPTFAACRPVRGRPRWCAFSSALSMSSTTRQM